MDKLEITSLSSKGQIVIPQKIRRSMNLKTGEKFIIIHEGDTLILKAIEVPLFKNFDRLISKAKKFAKNKGLQKKDIKDAISSIRNKQR